jgi:nicotinamidase-related amidase
MLLRADRSSLIVVDLQERLLPGIDGAEACLERCGLLINAARALAVPIVASEQYPEGLGHTVEPIARLLDGVPVLAKVHFSCADEPLIRARLAGLGREVAVICGTEAHVCVLQTALGLVDAGWEVAVVADATASRRVLDRDRALERLARAGVLVVTSEMVVFEWLGRADTPAFRELIPLIRGPRARIDAS